MYFVLTLLFCASFAMAQSTHPDHNYFQLSPRVGLDFPTYNNGTPYIDYNSGLMVGLSADYYFSWIGLGVDFDYINNNPENTYPTTNVFDSASGSALTDFSLTEEGITRIFYGIGPSFKYMNGMGNFHAELNTRVGLASLKGGRTQLTENTVLNQTLNFHAGYDASNLVTAKGQLRFTYFFNETFGAHIGGYYTRHFDVEEATEGGISASYYNLDEQEQGSTVLGINNVREEACVHDISSVGVFAGLTIKLKSQHKESCCTTCDTYALAVTAKDEFTGELLPQTSVALKDASGAVIQTGVTNDFGVVVFDDVVPADYVIEGLLYDVALENSTINKGEFIKDQTLQKEIIYGDRNFIIKGKAVVCNTPTGLPGVNVILKNTAAAEEKNTMTDASGDYIHHLSESGNYTLRGIKNNYFSQTVAVNPSNYDRDNTLFVKLEICLEEADCGKAITLQNILYDLDEFFIREDAKPELNRLAQFLIDNPGIRIEVSSHTDSRGSNSYNQTLSQNRASAAVDYVVSQGVARSRISGIGYGEARLLNNCSDNQPCSEDKHQLNRRTEMKVICN